MSASFHIITSSHFSKNGNLMARDYYGNVIHFPKRLLESSQFSISSEKQKYPIFILALIEEHQRLTRNSRDIENNFKRLTGFYICDNILKIFDVYLDDAELHLGINKKIQELIKEDYPKTLRSDIISNFDSAISDLNKIKKVVDEYINFNVCKQLALKRDEISIMHDEIKIAYFDIGELILLDFRCHPLIDLLKKQNCRPYLLNDPDDNYAGQEDFLRQLTKDNAIYINRIPLFPKFTGEGPRNKAYKKIIDLEKLRELKRNLDLSRYIDQFYELEENFEDAYISIFDPDKEFSGIYKTESNLDFWDRCRDKFDKPFLYKIEPVFYKLDDSISVEKLHDRLLQIGEILNSANISNLIFYPPKNMIDDMIRYEESRDEYLGECYYNEYMEAADQEMRTWDEETDGSWRIENDFD